MRWPVDGGIEAACRHLVASCDPIDDVRGSAVYRAEAALELVRRALRQIAEPTS